MKVVITGVTGFAGSHLAEYALTLGGVEVFGTYRWRSRMDHLQDLNRAGKLNFISEGVGHSLDKDTLSGAIIHKAKSDALNLLPADLNDPNSIARVIGAIGPDRVFHLAAHSFVPTSWTAPEETLRVNVIGQTHLLEAVVQAGLDARIHIAGSSEQYGQVFENEVPIRETNPLRPLSPYAVSKVAQEIMAVQYFRTYGLHTVVTRSFNHSGPRRGEFFATSSFAKQIAEIEKGLRAPVVNVGDLTSQRDWSDVRDIVRAYWLSLETGVAGEVYNVGSGTARSLQEMLDTLLSLSGHEVAVERDPSRMRPSDVRLLHCDYSKFNQATGWNPTIPFEQTMHDLLNYWRSCV